MAVSKVLTIEISDLVTKVSEMSYNKKQPTVFKSVIFSNPEFAVEDGFISDRGVLGEALRNALKDEKIKCKDTVFVLTSNKIMSREVTIPEMKPELIDDFIENERAEYFPMDTSDHVFTYHIIEKLKDQKQYRIMVFAAPEILIKNYQAFAAENDLKIIALDYNGNTVYQWLKNSGAGMDMYLQINEKNSIFTIMENGYMSLQRNMNFGSATMINSLAYSGYFGKALTTEFALGKLRDQELIYKSFAEMEDASPEDEEEQKLHIAKENLTESIRPFISNISRVLEYYHTKNREAQVSKIYIGGIGASALGLKELIASEFNGVEIEVVTTLPGAKFGKNNVTGNARSTELSTLIGVSMPAINFYKLSEKVKLEKTVIFSLVALALVIVSAIFIVLNGKIEYDNALAKKAQLETQVALIEAEGIEILENEYIVSRTKAAEVMIADEGTMTFNEKWNDILSYLESESVRDVIISSITSTETDLTMNIVVNSKTEAAKLLIQLQKIPYFEAVNTSAITENMDEETGLTNVSFSVNCIYKWPGAQPAQDAAEAAEND